MKCIIEEEDARGFKHLETTGIRNIGNPQCTGYKYKVEQTPQHILRLKFKTENLLLFPFLRITFIRNRFME